VLLIGLSSDIFKNNCSGPCKPDSQCRLSKEHIWLRETPGGRDFGMGRGWGDQFTSNLGPRWTGSYHSKEGFQVSKGKWKRESERGAKRQGDCAIIMLSVYMHVHNVCL
jgi:hypothetical protein